VTKTAFPISMLLLSWQVPCAAESRVTEHAQQPPPPPALELPLISGAVHLGLLSFGRGGLRNECAGECTGFAANSASYSDDVAVGLGADAFVNVYDLVRIGPALFYTFPNNVQIDATNTDVEVGSDLAIDLAVEVAPRITREVRLLPRVQAGATILFPGSDLRRILSVLSADCPTGTPGCNSIEAPYVGYNLGAGVGALYRPHPRFGLRADLLVQYYSVRLYEVDASLFTRPIHVSETVDGGRLFLMLGAEF
jgi:hypothetical protein